MFFDILLPISNSVSAYQWNLPRMNGVKWMSFSYLDTNFLYACPNNGTDKEDGDLKSAKNETKVPNF